MIFKVGKPDGYSLIELLVVLAVITLISLASLPNIFGRNDRLSLDTSANRIKQLLIDARTRSLAPSGKEAGNLGQVYQVSIGEFQPGQSDYTAVGTAATNLLTLERGSSRCDAADAQAGFTRLRELKLPRHIYVSSFFPMNPSPTETKAAVRFTVGKVGFNCGGYSDPSIDSTDFNDVSWLGKMKIGVGAAKARYLVIVVSAQKLGEKRYVVIDRQTSEVTVSKTDPQEFFTPFSDTLKPKWTDINLENFRMTLRCGNGEPTQVTIAYPRAEDRVTDPLQTDPNLAVFYDISWNVNGEQNNGQPLFRPLAIRYYYDVRPGFETVQYSFETTLISVGQQGFSVILNVAASDQANNLQDVFVQGAPDAIERARQKSFHILCGNGTVKGEGEGGDTRGQEGPDATQYSCTQQQSWLWNNRSFAVNRLWQRRLAIPVGEPCII